MSAAKKIKLPVVVFDSNSIEHIKDVHYDAELLKNKNIRDWDNKGKVVPNRSVLFTKLRPANKDDDYTVIALSRSDLINLLTEKGIIET